MARDLFEKAPEFLTAFDNIVNNGFFDELNYSALGSDGKVHYCSIKARGYIPSKAAYKAPGCGQLIKPADMIAQIRTLTSTRKLRNLAVEVKTEIWPLYDKGGNNIIGEKGTGTTLFFGASFKI